MTSRSRSTLGGPLLLALSVLFAVGYWSPAFLQPSATGFGDWQYFHHMWEVGFVAWKRFGEIALYDPYQCGGVPLWGDPQAQTYGPWFLLAIPFGTTLALKLGVVIHAAIGFAGAVRYASDELRLSRVASLVAAVVFAGSGFFAWHVAGGHSAFLPFYFAPALAWSVRRSATDPRHVVAAAGWLALTLYEGGVYPLPYFVIVVALESLLDRRRSELPSAIGRALAIGALGGLLGSARLIAAAVELSRHPRPTDVDDHLGLDEVARFLTDAEHDWRVPGHPYVFPEYCAYVGLAVVLLAAVGYHVAVRRRLARPVVGTLLFGLLMMGDLGELSPWKLLHEVPVFDSLRVPSRFAVLFAGQLGLCAAIAVDAIAKRSKLGPRGAALVSFAFLAFIATDVVLATRTIVNRWNGPPVPTSITRGPFEQRSGQAFGAEFASLPRLGQGSIGCYVVLDYPVAPTIRTGPMNQVVVDVGEGGARVIGRTTNTITLSVVARTEVRAVLNMNFAPDFATDHGRLENAGGRLAVRLPPGRRDVHLAFRPASVRWGIAPTLVGIAASLGILVASRRRRAT